jgi:LCP family protein required for cell wall assembly
MPEPSRTPSPAISGRPAQARHGRLARGFVAVSGALSILIFAGAAYGVGEYLLLRTEGTFEAGPPTRDVFGPCVEDVCNYLLLGSDSRAGLTPEEQKQFGTDAAIGGVNRADTVMLVQTDPSREKAVILSFPRDLWVDIPGGSPGKIATAFEGGVEGGGPDRMARTVHALTGLRINHVLYVDLAGFQGVVDSLGGVDMCIPFDMQDENTGLDLRAGCQRLGGVQALAYVRTRHLPCDAPAPDFFRISRQQQFLRAVINRLIQPSQLLRLSSMIGPVLSNIRRDRGLNPADLAHLVGELQGVSTGNVEFRAVPVYGAKEGGLSVVKAEPNARKLFGALRDGKALPAIGKQLINAPISEANTPVLVVDHGSGGKAADVERVLSQSGFNVAPGTTTFVDLGAGVAGNVIAYQPGHLEEAQVVARYFPGLTTKNVDFAGDAPVALFVTASYKAKQLGPGTQPTCVDPNA